MTQITSLEKRVEIANTKKNFIPTETLSQVEKSLVELSGTPFRLIPIFNSMNELTSEEQSTLYDKIFLPVMDHFYNQSGWNLDKQEKMKDLLADWMRMIVVKLENEIVAFAAFRFDMDEDRPVVYLYELHVRSDMQGKRIGDHLLRLLEVIAQCHAMDRVVLTTLKCNPRALQFYLKRGFEVDETSPSIVLKSKQKNKERFDKMYPYEILSKRTTQIVH